MISSSASVSNQRRSLAWFFAIISIGAVGLNSPNLLALDDEKITWDDNAAAVLRARCAACHNPDKKSADLDLTSYPGIMAGGASGASVEPGDPAASYLFKLVTHADEPSMPPGGTKIPDPEISVLEAWIAGGALETRSSKSRAKKKGPALSAGGGALTRPELVTSFPRLKLEPFQKLDRSGTVGAMAAHPWASFLAVAVPRQILLFDSGSLELRGVLPFPEGQAQVLRFSRSGEVLLAGGGQDGASGLVVLWDVRTGERIGELGSELDTVLAADISADHSLVALGGPQKVVRVFSTADSALKYEIRKHTDWITALEFSPDGVLLATGDRNGGLFVWHSPTGNDYLTLNGHTGAISATTWRADSNVLVSASEDTTARAWEMENGGQIKTISAHGGGVTDAVFGRDNQLYTSGRDLAIKSWNPAGDPLATFSGLADVATSVAIASESGRVFGGDWQGNLIAWNLADGAESGRLNLAPATLAEQLAVAGQARNGLKQSHLAASTEMGQLQEQLQKATAELEAAAAAVAALQPVLTAAQEQATKLLAEQESLVSGMAALNAESTTLTGVLPELETLAVQAAKVAGLAPADAELVATSQQLATKLENSRQRIIAVAEQVAKDSARIAEIGALKLEIDQKVMADEAALTAAKAAMDVIQQQVDQQKTGLASAETRLQELSVQLSAAESSVVRWAGEVDFVAQWDRLKAAIASADQQISSAEAQREQSRSELEKAQSAMQSADAGVQEAEGKKSAIEAELDLLRGSTRDDQE